MSDYWDFQVPLHKEPNWLWNTLDKWLKICDDKLTKGIPEMMRGILEQKDLREETKWLKNRLESENSPVVFCHNDLQEGNILIARDVDLENNDIPQLVIIGMSILFLIH